MRVPLREYWRLGAPYLRPLWRRVALMAALILGGIALQLVSPLILRYFIDTATTHGSARGLDIAALLFIGSAVVQQALSIWATHCSQTVAWTATNGLRRDLAAQCIDLDMRFHNTHTPGALIERIDGDVTLLANFVSEFAIQIVGNALLVIGVLIMLFRLDWRIGLAMCLFTLVLLAVLNTLRGLATPYWIAGRQATAEITGFLEERLAGTEDIRSNRATGFVMGQFFELMGRVKQSYRGAHVMGSISLGLTRVGFAVGLVVGLAVGSYLYLHHEVSIGTVFLTAYYAGILAWPLANITDQMDDFQQAGAGVIRIRTLLDTPIDIANSGTRQLPVNQLNVEFDHVTFGYRPEEPVIDDLSFDLPAGHVLGLLGRTGSGKTTISRLLFRLYEPQSGMIRLGGLDIRSIELSDLQRHIGLVTQDVQLFHASVRDNLTFFDHTVSDRAILEAIDVLGLGAWYAALSDGMDTQLKGATGLSAGEAQLLAMTRMLLKDPSLIILDEASSRLDVATEQLLERAVDRLLAGRTAIVIAHRLRTVQRADSIMVLRDRRMLEYGRRIDLMANPASHFSQLLRRGLELEIA
jgi:ATP-binding cassette, subfamily B, bacterial